MTGIQTKLLLASTAIIVTSIGCSSPPTDAPPESVRRAAAAAKAGAPSISACRLVTAGEIQAAAGWSVSQSVPTENPGPPALSICNFMGADLTRVITVWYGEGSGGGFNTSAEMAAALGTRDGMLAKPAQALDGFDIPTTREDQRGGLVHVHGITGAGNELTVAAASFDTARVLFVAALARLPKS